jgi:transcriptional regulator with XRE-family HTH domain
LKETAIFEAIIEGLRGAGLTRAEISRRSGLSPTTIWRAENGELRQPSFSTYARLADVAKSCGVPVTATRSQSNGVNRLLKNRD